MSHGDAPRAVDPRTSRCRKPNPTGVVRGDAQPWVAMTHRSAEQLARARVRSMFAAACVESRSRIRLLRESPMSRDALVGLEEQGCFVLWWRGGTRASGARIRVLARCAAARLLAGCAHVEHSEPQVRRGARDRRAGPLRGLRPGRHELAGRPGRSAAGRARARVRRRSAAAARPRQRHGGVHVGAADGPAARAAAARRRSAGVRPQRSARLRRPLAAGARGGAAHLAARRPRARAGADRRHVARRDVGAVPCVGRPRPGWRGRGAWRPGRGAAGHARRPVLHRAHYARAPPGGGQAGLTERRDDAPEPGERRDRQACGRTGAGGLLCDRARGDARTGLEGGDAQPPEPRHAPRPAAARRTSSPTPNCAPSRRRC